MFNHVSLWTLFATLKLGNWNELTPNWRAHNSSRSLAISGVPAMAGPGSMDPWWPKQMVGGHRGHEMVSWYTSTSIHPLRIYIYLYNMWMVNLYLYLSMSTSIQLSTYLSIYLSMSVSISIYVYIYIFRDVHTHIYIYMYIYNYIYRQFWHIFHQLHHRIIFAMLL